MIERESTTCWTCWGTWRAVFLYGIAGGGLLGVLAFRTLDGVALGCVLLAAAVMTEATLRLARRGQVGRGARSAVFGLAAGFGLAIGVFGVVGVIGLVLETT